MSNVNPLADCGSILAALAAFILFGGFAVRGASRIATRRAQWRRMAGLRKAIDQ